MISSKAMRKRLKTINIYRNNPRLHLKEEPFRLGFFTCDNCAAVEGCFAAFDLYNTNGDCLMEK